MSIEYQNSILWRGEDPLKKKINLLHDKSKKVERYRPGQVPKWAQDEEAAQKKRKTFKHPSEKADEEEEVDKLEIFSGKERRPEPLRKDRGTTKFSGKDGEEKKTNKKPSPEPERRRRRDRAPVAAVVLEAAAPQEDSRMKRLKAASETVAVDPSDRLVRHRVIHEARVVEAAAEKEKDDEEEKTMVLKKEEDFDGEKLAPVAELQLPNYDDISGDEPEDIELRTLRRERARETALEKRKAEEEQLKEELGDEEEESSEEDSEDSEDDDPRRSALLKPVFVSKTQRETVREKEAQQVEEEAAKQRDEERKTEKKVESKSLLVDTIRHEEEVEAAALLNDDDKSDIELINDDDEMNEAEEYELWKIRELKRIKRDKVDRLERQQELELIERRRRMTDTEREEDDKRMDGKATKRDDTKQFAFLQKYYHRGTFFQDKATSGEEPLYNRDYHEPTAEETFDKSMLPKAMQLRRGQFGKKGQVKHTHLTDVDTTDQTAAWSQQTKVMDKYQQKMASAKSINVFDRNDISASSRAPKS